MAAMADGYDSDEALETKIATGATEGAVGAEEEEDTTLNNSDVCTKYQDAAKIAMQVTEFVAGLCVVGAKVTDICRAGDEKIKELTSDIYKGKSKSGQAIDKGVAFPVCISVNDIVAHYSPLESENEMELAENDLAKIDLGVHVDGYMSFQAHTVLVGRDESKPLEGPLADAYHCAWTIAEVVGRMAKPGGSSAELQEAVNSVADAFGVNVYSGSTLHQVKRFVPDATKKVSLSSHHEAAKSEKCEFEAGEVYAIDLAVTTGEGKQKDGKHRTTVFRRRVETKYALKNKASRVLLNEINDMCPSLCFSMRMFKDEAAAKMGIRELDAHALVEPYKVMYEEKDAQVIHVKYTILLLPSGNIKVTGLPLPANINSEKVGNLPAAITELLASTSLEKKKKVRSKKKKTG